MSNGIDIAIENLKTGLNDIKLKISEYRKIGLDTKIAELKVMNLPYKIKLAETTKSYKDIEKVNSMLEDVKNEIESIENVNKPSLNNNNLSQISILIDKINKAIDETKLSKAKNYYLEAVELYKSLKISKKKEVFAKLNEIRNKLAKK
jgi:hypothetical protein